jgi:catechol 2,3-dioxygenase-like lactoylglutathione lyase family enzyme
MAISLAHTAVCVPDVDAAVAWYRDALGLRVLSPPYRMDGEAIERDMGELVPSPVVVKAAILGFEAGDHVVEVIEYPNAHGAASATGAVVDTGITHIGVVCTDADAERSRLVAAGATALTTAVADVAGLRTAWVRDPFGVVWILLEKGDADRPYWNQHSAPHRARPGR